MNDLRVDALGLVAVGGTALLSAAVAVTERRLRAVPITAVGVAVAVMAAGAVTRHRGEGAAALAVMVAAAVVAEVALGSIRRARTAGVVAAAVGAVAVAVAGVLESDAAALVAVVGAGLVVGVVVTTGRVGIVAVPAVVLALAEHLADASSQSAADRAGVAAAVLGVAAAVVPSRLMASRWRPRPVAFSGGRGAVFAFAVAYVVVAQPPAELRSAGLLLCGGAVVAVASSHRFGLVALVPGLAAAVEALGVADRPVHAVAGVAVLGIVVAAWRAGADRPVGGDDPDEFDSAQQRPRPASPLPLEFDPREHWALPLAVIVAVVPTWGWSGADVGAGYNSAVAAAVASAAIAGIIFFGRLRRAGPASSAQGMRR